MKINRLVLAFNFLLMMFLIFAEVAFASPYTLPLGSKLETVTYNFFEAHDYNHDEFFGTNLPTTDLVNDSNGFSLIQWGYWVNYKREDGTSASSGVYGLNTISNIGIETSLDNNLINYDISGIVSTVLDEDNIFGGEFQVGDIYNGSITIYNDLIGGDEYPPYKTYWATPLSLPTRAEMTIGGIFLGYNTDDALRLMVGNDVPGTTGPVDVFDARIISHNSPNVPIPSAVWLLGSGLIGLLGLRTRFGK